MSKLAPIYFSAAHISKWDTLPEATLTSVIQSRYTRPPADDSPDDVAHETETKKNKPETSITTKPSHENMTTKTYTWITLWFLLSAPVVIWDVGYCFFRPRSMFGGDLHWIWAPYALYQEVDYVYGLKSLEENSGFPNAQALLNVVETTLNLAYVYLANVSGWPGAPLIGFVAAAMTLSKTVLYWAQEYYCGGCAAGHNTWGDLLLYWALPNGLWIVFPGMVVWQLGGDIINTLCVASQRALKAASGKMQ